MKKNGKEDIDFYMKAWTFCYLEKRSIPRVLSVHEKDSEGYLKDYNKQLPARINHVHDVIRTKCSVCKHRLYRAIGGDCDRMERFRPKGE